MHISEFINSKSKLKIVNLKIKLNIDVILFRDQHNNNYGNFPFHRRH